MGSMGQDSANADDLTQLLAEATGRDPEVLEAEAEEFHIEDPAEAEWEYIEE